MNGKATHRQLITLSATIAMLAVALLLPLVNLMSYRFTLFDLPHKIQRLVPGAAPQALAYVLLLLLLLAPVVLSLLTWLKGKAPKGLVALPCCTAALLTTLLLLAKRPDPGVGLWVYLAVAATLLFTLRRNFS